MEKKKEKRGRKRQVINNATFQIYNFNTNTLSHNLLTFNIFICILRLYGFEIQHILQFQYQPKKDFRAQNFELQTGSQTKSATGF